MLIRKKIKHAGWMWLDPEDHGVGQRLNAQGYREPGFMWMLRTEARGAALDIGANIGYCTLTMARRCESVTAYEPDPRTNAVLLKNVDPIPNVYPYTHALSDVDGEWFLEQAERPNLSRLNLQGGLPVMVSKLDTLYPGGGPTFIKMDIEGGEVGVIHGGKELLSKSPKMKIAMELHPERYGPNNDMAAKLDWLLSVGYRFKYVENAKGKLHEFTRLGYRPYRTFPNTDRAIFKDLPETRLLVKWCTEMPADGKKVVRSILLVKEQP